MAFCFFGGERSDAAIPPAAASAAMPQSPQRRRAKQCRRPHRSLPPCSRHTRLTIVRRGLEWSRNVGIHGEAMYTAPDSASVAALQAANSQCAGSRGKAPRPFSRGLQRGILSFEKESIPLLRTPARCRKSPRACAEQFANGFVRPFPESLWQHKHRSPMRATANA